MKSMKQSICAVVASAFVLLSLTVLSGAVQPAGAQEILIGMNCPVTGGSASEGALFLKAMKLAVKHINAAGGVNGKSIKVIPQDNQSSNPGALASLNKSIEQDKVLIMLGPVKSTQILAISDAVKGFGVPMAIGGTNATLTRKGNPWLFRCRPDDSIAAAAMVKYIKEDYKLTKVGILHDSDAFGTGGADLVEQGSKENGLTVVKREKYTTKDKDYTAQLLSLKNAGAQVMVIYGTNPEDVAIIQRQYRQLGSPYKYMGSPSSAMRDCLVLSKEAAEGLLAVTDYVPGASEQARKYAEEYKKEFGEDMDATAAFNYDALNIMAIAMRKAGTDRAKIMKEILAVKDYKGVLGTFSFTPNGDGLHEVSVISIEKGAHKLQKVVQVAPK
jgi:branched-chain amino acid transport system substrate-binding protein